MPLIIPRPSPYGLLNGDPVLYDLLMDLHSWQHRVRSSWICSRDCVCNDLAAGAVHICLLDHNGEATTIPDYFSYDKTWLNAGFYRNPFEVRWLDYVKDNLTSRYVLSVVDTLDEQMVLWGVHDTNRECLVFENFTKFAEALRRLYEYDIVDGGDGATSDTVSLTSNDDDDDSTL